MQRPWIATVYLLFLLIVSAAASTVDDGLVYYEELRAHAHHHACREAAPSFLTDEQKEQLCAQSDRLGEYPAHCAAQIIGIKSTKLAQSTTTLPLLIKLCATAPDLGPAYCWQHYEKRIKKQSPNQDDQELLLTLCRRAQDATPVDCYVESKTLLEKLSGMGVALASSGATVEIARGCSGFQGELEPILDCMKQLPKVPRDLPAFRHIVCAKASKSSIYSIVDCVKALMPYHPVIPSLSIASVCATADRKVEPQHCLVAAHKTLARRKVEPLIQRRLCQYAKTTDPVDCMAALRMKLKTVDDSYVVDFCKQTENATKVIECVQFMTASNAVFSTNEQIKICAPTRQTRILYEPEDEEDAVWEPEIPPVYVASSFPRACVQQAQGIKFANAPMTVGLCDQATSLAPVDCVNAVRQLRPPHTLSNLHMIELCHRAESEHPQTCLQTLTADVVRKLSIDQAVRLCQQANMTAPAHCMNRLARDRPSVVATYGVDLCKYADSEMPALCFKDAPPSFSDFEKLVLCAQADSLMAARCASVSVTRLRSSLEKAELCHRAVALGSATCAIQAPHGMNSLEVLALCREARHEFPAKCASVVPAMLRIPKRLIADVCQDAQSLTPGHCLAHSRRHGREPLTRALVEKCRETEAQPASLAIAQFEYACAKLMPKCLVFVKVAVYDQFGEFMAHYSNRLRVQMQATHHDEPLMIGSVVNAVRGSLSVNVVNGTAIFRNIYFTTPGDFVLRFHANGIAIDEIARVHIYENLVEKQQIERCNGLFLQLTCLPDQHSHVIQSNTSAPLHVLQLPLRYALRAMECESRWSEGGGLSYQGSTSSHRMYAIHPAIYNFITGSNVPTPDMTPWECLDLPEGSNRSEIRRAYHRKSLEWHPDKWSSNATALFRDQVEVIYALITDAYQQLLEYFDS